jgi:hypothetical protein
MNALVGIAALIVVLVACALLPERPPRTDDVVLMEGSGQPDEVPLYIRLDTDDWR